MCVTHDADAVDALPIRFGHLYQRSHLLQSTPKSRAALVAWAARGISVGKTSSTTNVDRHLAS
eukprot:3307225-Amphidinium_carterae.1